MKKDKKITETEKKEEKEEEKEKVDEKQKYYFPQEGVVIEATSLAEAILLKNKK